MATIQITVPDELEQRAREAGLLSDDAMREMLEGAVRRRAAQAFLAASKAIQEAGIAPMTMDDIVAEVRAVRAAMRAKAGAGGS